MSRRGWCGGALVALVVSVCACEEPSPEVGTRLVPARVIPVPTTVSPELQRAIAKPVIGIRGVRSAEEWRALRRESDEEVAALARARATLLGVTVRPIALGAVNASVVRPAEPEPANANRLLVHLHGGAYMFNSGEASTSESVLLAHFSKIPVLSVDYRVTPDHPFPAALDDVLAAWKVILDKHDPAKTGLCGTSAGGGLAMALLFRLRALGLPFPGALLLGSPWADLSKSSDTYFTHAGVDNMLGTYDGGLESAAKLYAGKRPLTDPMISPVYGDVSGFPPAILLSGTRDLLLSDTVRTHRKLRQAGVEAELHVFEGQSHAQYITSYPAPESREAFGEVGRFFDRHLKR